MNVRVLYFAAARELAATGSEELTHTSDALTLAQFVSWLGEQKPRLAPYLARMRFAVDGELAQSETQITHGAEVVVMPPVAGGSDRDHHAACVLADVRDTPLSIDEVVAAVRHESAGAIALFIGVVRDHHDGKPVQRLDYEAYRALAVRQLREVVETLMATHAGARVAAVHRVGELAVGDFAVVVAASSAHRDAAFTLCRSAIDRIKESVAIWKKEWSPDGSAQWVNLEFDDRK